MMRREPALFALAAILFALFAAFMASVPLQRAASKLGAWDRVWPMVEARPVYWFGAILARLLLAALLFWLVLRVRRRSLWRGYAALAAAALAAYLGHFALWLLVGLG